MKNPLLILCGLVVVVLFTALIAPFLINWNAYRAEIENEARRILGRQVSIKGDIEIHLLPSSTVRLTGVEVKGTSDADSAALASINLVKAKLALAPLLRGKFKFTDVELVQPTFRFEISAGGVPNWEIEKDRNFGKLIAARNIILDDVLITGGSLFFQDAKRRVAYDLSAIDARISARALVGPYTATGRLSVTGQVREFNLRAGRANDDNIRRLSLRLIVPGKEEEQIIFDGHLDTSDKKPGLEGKVVLNQEIGQFDIFKPLAGKSKDKVFGKFQADVSTSFVGVRLEKIIAVVAQGKSATRFTGRAQALWQDSSDFIVELSSKRFDLDSFLPVRSGAKVQQPKAKPAQLNVSAASANHMLGLLFKAVPGIWQRGLEGRVFLKADTVVIGGQSIDKASLKIRLAEQHIEVLKASGRLPGRSELDLKGIFLSQNEVAKFDGTFEFKTADAKNFTRWLVPSLTPLMGKQVSGHNGRLIARGDLKLEPKSIDLLNMKVNLDETKATAGLSYAFRQRPAFGLALELDQLNLDRYFPRDQTNQKAASGGFAGAQFMKDVADLFVRFDANIRLNAGELISRDIRTRGFAADVSLKAGELTINQLNIADIAGGSVITKGSISDINGEPSGRLDASLVASNPADFFDLLGLGQKIGKGRDREELTRNFGPLDIGISYEISFDRNQPQHQVKITGMAGGTNISSHLQLQGRLNDLEKSKIDLTSKAVNEDGARLLAQLGLAKSGKPVKPSQPGVLRARIKGKIARDLDIGFGLRVFGANASLSGQVRNVATKPVIDVDVSLESEDARPLLGVLRASLLDHDATALPISLQGLLKGDISAIRLSNIDGTIGNMPASLNGMLNMQSPVPKISANVQVEEISLPWIFNTMVGGIESVAVKKPDDDQMWPTRQFDLSRLKNADVKINLQADRMFTATTRIDEVKAFFRSQRGRFDLKQLSGRLYGGELDLNATLDEVDDSLKLTSEYTLIDGDIEQIARVREKRWAIDGKTYISGQVKATGRSVAGLFSSMEGTGIIKIQDGVLNGVNPAAFAKILGTIETEDELNAAINDILAKGEMEFGDVESSFSIKGGLLGTTDLLFNSPSVSGKTSLVIDLTGFKLDNEWRFLFDELPNSPPLLLLYTGLVNAPDRTFKTKGLREFLAVKTVKKNVLEL